MKKLIACIILCIIIFYPGFTEGDRENSVSIIYTSSLNGNLDGCTCESVPKAGLVKRAHYLRSITDRENILLVDTGDILDIYYDTLLAQEIFEVYQELGYDFIAVGDQEFTNRIDKLLEYKDNYPLISHNLAICPDENSCILFPIKPIVLKKGEYKLGIFSIIDPDIFDVYPGDVQKKIKISNPEQTAQNALTVLRQQGINITILLYHGYHANVVRLAQAVPGIDVIILGHEQKLIDAEMIGGSIIVSPGEGGNRTGILQIHMHDNKITGYNNSFILFDYKNDADDPAVRKRIDRYIDELKLRLVK